MKKVILAGLTLVGFAGMSLLAASAVEDLTREARAGIENALLRELSPSVGVFDYVAFKVEGDGTVTLMGQVQQAPLKGRMAEDAKKVEGVKRVQNQIEVLPLSPDDDRIRRAVHAAIYNQNGFERYRLQASPPVHIIVKNGSVTLEGQLASDIEYAQIKAAANNIPGVFSVQNNVKINKGK